MPQPFVLATGTIDGEVDHRKVGEDQKTKASFRLACQPRGWYTVVAWGELADQVPASGEFVIVTGRLSTRSYDKDGQKVYVTEIVASGIEAPGFAVEEAQAPAAPASKTAADLDSLFAD